MSDKNTPTKTPFARKSPDGPQSTMKLIRYLIGDHAQKIDLIGPKGQALSQSTT